VLLFRFNLILSCKELDKYNVNNHKIILYPPYIWISQEKRNPSAKLKKHKKRTKYTLNTWAKLLNIFQNIGNS
jgi:hypothetical protein